MKRRVVNCEGQEDLFPVAEFDTGKPVKFAPLSRPLWTERKAALVARYLHYFVFLTYQARDLRGRLCRPAE